MADREVVRNKDGPFKTNLVKVESDYLLAAEYTLVRFNETEMEPTGRLNVIGIFPSSDESADDPRFLGRCFEVELRTERKGLIFRGVVSVALGFRMHMREGIYLTETLEAKLIRKPPADS